MAAAPLPPSFGGAPEESGSRGGNEGQEPERSKYAKIDTASGSSMPGGLPGGAPQWGPQPHEEGHGLCRGGAGRGARRRDGSVAGAATELARGLATLRVCGSARRKGVWGEGASWRERRQAALHGEELLEEAGGAGARGASWQAGGTGGGLPWMGEMVRLDEDPQVAGWGTWRGEWREGQCGCVCWTDPESNGRDV